MSPINKFRKIEDNNLRGDNYEGVNEIWNLPSGKFEIPSLNHKGNYISMHLRMSYDNVPGNIYSLYCISSYGFEAPNEFFIDQRVKEFGSHFVFIKDLPEFFKRMKSHLKLLGHKFHDGFVEYYDKNRISGRIKVFQKPYEFEYQKEFRFYVDRDEILPLSFKIGSLTDIAEMFPSEFASELKLTQNKIR
ncbi:MAG: hypothetical protein ABI237_14890 [Ginsengibacter sp.]